MQTAFPKALYLFVLLWTFSPVAALLWGQESLKDSLWIDAKVEEIKDLRYEFPDSSLLACEELLAFSEEKDLGRGIWLALNGKGLTLARSHRYEAAESAYTQALSISERNENPLQKAATYLNLSSLFTQTGDYPQAAEMAQSGLDLSLKSDWPRGISGAYLNLAIVYKTQGDSANTINYYKKTLKISRREGFHEAQANVLHNISSLYLETGPLDSLKKYLELGFAHISQHPNPFLENRFRTIKAVYLFKLGENEEAEQIAETTAQNLQDKQDLDGLAGLYIHLGNALKRIGQADRAIDYGLRALKLSKSIDSPEHLKSNYRLLSYAYELKGDYHKALDYNKIYHQLRDSLKNVEFYSDLNKLRLEKEAADQARELSQLSLQIEQSNNSQRILIAGLAFTLLLAFFFIYRQRVNRRRNQLLVEKQRIVERSLHEKETLLAEVHHRVKNNLQMIYNLLDLQSRDLHDEHAKNAILSSRNRVASMALVHQKLYRNEDLSAVHLPNYLEQLLADLRNSLSREGRIRFHLDCENLSLELDSAIPIGLIVNELLTNALKHAFPEASKGNIWVSLHEKEGLLMLEVRDDGRGYSGESRESSFGLRLIRSLARQLKAQFTIEAKNGTLAQLRIRKYKKIDHAHAPDPDR